MIEMIIVFSVGVLLTAIIGFLISPILWRRAEASALNRVQGSMPLLTAEIEAEKDSCRAEYAVKLLQMEQEMDIERHSRMQAERVRADSERRLAIMKKEHDSLLDKSQNLQISLSALQAEFVASESHVLDLTRQNRDLMQQTAREDIALADLQAKLAKAEINLDSLKDSLSREEEKTTKLSSELTHEQASARQAESELKQVNLELTSQCDDLRNHLEEAEQSNRALNSRLQDYVGKAKHQSEQISRLKEALQQQEEAFTSLSKSYSKAEDSLRAIEKQKEDSSEQLETLADEVLSLREERSQFQTSLRTLARERDQSVQEQDRLKTSSEEMEALRKAEIEALGRQRNDLQKRYEQTLEAIKQAGFELIQDDELNLENNELGNYGALKLQERGSRRGSVVH